MLDLKGWEILIIYIPTFLFLLIFIWQLIAGLRRGLRKSTILFVNMVIAMAVTLISFFIFFGSRFDERLVTYYNTFSNWFHFSSLETLFGTTEAHANLSDYILDAIVLNISNGNLVISDTVSLGAVIQLVLALAESIVRYVAFILMSFVYAFVKFLLYIVYLIFFKEKRYKKKVVKNFCAGVSTKEYKPRHLWGMAVGALRGLVVGIFIFSFIGGAFHLITNGEYSNEPLVEDDIIVNDSFRINSVIEMVNRYGKTGVGQVLESIGTKKNGPWYLLIADSIISTNYSVTIDGEKVEGTFVPRKELGPIMGLVKDGYILFRDYDVDINKIGDPTYLSNALNFEKDGITLTDKLDKLIKEHEFGQYTINLCQSFLNAVMANIPDTTADEENNNDVSAKLLNCIFKGEHAIKASSLVTNDSISNALNLAITVLANYNEINDFVSQFTNNAGSTQSLVFGFKPLTAETKKSYDGVKETLVAIGDYIGNLECIQDGLISDIVIIFLDTLSADGVEKIDSFKNAEYITSCEQVKWKDNLKNICNIVADFISHITEYNLYDTDALLNDIIDNLDNENSDSRKLVDQILDADFSGVILNNPNLLGIISDTVNKSTNGLINLNTNLKLGSYYESNGNLHNGDLTNIIKNFISEAKTIYNIIKENTNDSKKIVEKIFSTESITSKLASIVDSTSGVYSMTLHTIISSALINLDKVILTENSGMTIVIEEQYISDNLIKSDVLTEALSTIIKYVPVFLNNEFDYKKDITVEMVNDLGGIKLLRASVSEAIYYALSQVDKIQNYIPNTYSLGKDNNNHLAGWTKSGGEIDTLLTIINAGEKPNDSSSKSLLKLLLNYNSDTDIISEFLAYDEATLKEIEDALLKSNVLNCIIAGFIEDIKINDTNIKLPRVCLTAVGNKYKINSDLNLFTIIKKTDLYSVIKSDDITNEVLNYLFDSNNIDMIFDNRIINSIMVQSLISINSGVKIIVPTSSYTAEAIANNDKIIKTTEINGAIDILKVLFIKDEDNKYDINKIDYNKIFEISLDKTDIIGATISSIIRTKTKSPVKIPALLSEADLEANYIGSGWKEETSNIIDGLKALNIRFEADGNVTIKVNDVIQRLNDIEEGSSKTNLDRMYASDILKLTMYNAIDSLSNDAIKIPEDAIDALDKVKDDKFIKETEIKCLVDAINALGITDVENFNVNAIFKDEAKLDILGDALSESTILRYTTTSYLTKNEKTVFVPDCSYDTTTISKMISISEAKALIDVVKICGDLDSFNYNNIFEKTADDIIKIVNESYIIRSTVTNNLKKNNNIGIPESAYDVEAAKYGKELKASDRNKMLSETEVEGLVSIIKAINLNSTDDFDYDSVFKLDSNIITECLSKSTVLRYTIGSKLNANNEIIVPNAAYDKNIKVDDCLLDVDVTKHLYNKVLSQDELDSLFDIIRKCGNTTKGFDFNTLFNDPDLDLASDINNSFILRKTVTEKMPDNILIPLIACEDIDNDTFIKKDEITALFDVIKKCDSDTNSFDYNDLLGNENISSIVNGSDILRATVSSKLKESNVIKIPNEAVESLELYRSNSNINVITKDEMDSLFEGISKLGLLNTNSFEFDDFLAIEKIDQTINASLVLRYTVTNTICNTSVLFVTTQSMDDNYESTIIDKEELTNLINAINTLDVSSLEDTDISISKINNNLDVILESSILASTISQEMYKNKCKLDSMYNIVTRVESFYAYGSSCYVMNKEYIKEYVTAICNILKDDASYGASINLSYNSQDADTIKKMADSRIILLSNSDTIIEYVNVLNLSIDRCSKDKFDFSEYKIDIDNYTESVDDIISYENNSYSEKSEIIISDVDGLIEKVNLAMSIINN